jgi:hypothetical protein
MPAQLRRRQETTVRPQMCRKRRTHGTRHMPDNRVDGLDTPQIAIARTQVEKQDLPRTQ